MKAAISFVAVMLIITLGLTLAVSLTGCETMSGEAEKRTCFANQRVISGAVMTYETDHGEYPTDIGEMVGETLKKMPECPSGGKYSLVSGYPPSATCSVHGSVTEEE